jgi:hypothetical protein
MGDPELCVGSTGNGLAGHFNATMLVQVRLLGLSWCSWPIDKPDSEVSYGFIYGFITWTWVHMAFVVDCPAACCSFS